MFELLRLRDWVKKKAEREREREEKRAERAIKRKQALTDRSHHFNDQDYDRQKKHVLEQLDDALTQGKNFCHKEWKVPDPENDYAPRVQAFCNSWNF